MQNILITGITGQDGIFLVDRLMKSYNDINILGVSRNSVAGKAHRMGLPKRSSPISSEKKQNLSSAKETEIDNKIIPLKIKLRGVPWSRTKCCWPEGDPKQNDFKFCGQDIFPGRPYCDKHSLLAYTNTRENS